MEFRARFLAKRIAESLFPLLILALFAAPLAAQSKSSSSGSPNAQEVARVEGVRGEKLILKDGTYELVRDYKIIGNRVRYYSVERSDWEEIPKSLVDWPATRKANKQAQEQAKQAAALAHAIDMEEHPDTLTANAGLGLPKGVLLPSGEGMFAFNGHSVLQLHRALAKSSLNKGQFIASVLIPVPVLARKYTVFLKGKHAAVQIDNPEPVFYYRTSENMQPRFRLVRTQIKGKRREIEFLSNYYGEKSTKANEIPLHLQQVEPDTFRLMATEDLSPGEYVLAQIDRGQGIDLYVWDFGIGQPQGKHPAKK